MSIRAEQKAVAEDQRQTVILLEKARDDSDFKMVHIYEDRLQSIANKRFELERQYQSSPDVLAEREYQRKKFRKNNPEAADLFDGLADGKNNPRGSKERK